MIFHLTLKKSIIINALLVLISTITQLPDVLNVAAGIIFLFFNAAIWGNWLFLKNSWTCKIVYGFLFNLVIAGLIGTAAFYFYQINSLVQLATMLIIAIISLFLNQNHRVVWEFERPKIKIDWQQLTLIIGYLFLVSLISYFLWTNRTTESIRSPWEVVPPLIFALYGLATFLLYAILQKDKINNFWLVCVHLGLSFSAAIIIYQLGFDYDPFIHRTNIQLIMDNGTLLPKPFYYIGQYSIIIFLSRLLSITPALIDKLMVPLLAAIYLPTTIYYAVKDNLQTEHKIIAPTILTMLLLFPFGYFISTTPQALSNLLLLITIWLALYYINHPRVSLWPLFLLVLLTITVHPLTGLPLFFFFCLLLFYQHHRQKMPLPAVLHRSIFWEIIILGSISLPIAFFINSVTLSELKIGLNKDALTGLLNFFQTNNFSLYYRQFISTTDFIYSFGKNTLLLSLAIALIGLIFIVKNTQFKKYVVYLGGFIIALTNFFLLKYFISFLSLVAYEQQNYPQRVLTIAIYFLSPFIFIAVYLLFKRLKNLSWISRALCLMLFSLLLTAAFYLAYPRVDKIVENHGYSTSATDVKTVNFLENRQRNRPYVVLASQPVSAAAIQELGFKYYYNNYFFYPVPTGGRLYGLYENLVYGKEPTNDTIATVQYLTGVSDIYFVINSYWLNSASRIEAEKENAQEWFSLDNKNFIFHYTKKY